MHYLLSDGTITTTPTTNAPVSTDGGVSFVLYCATDGFVGNDYSANFSGCIKAFSTDCCNDYWTRDGGASWGSL